MQGLFLLLQRIRFLHFCPLPQQMAINKEHLTNILWLLKGPEVNYSAIALNFGGQIKDAIGSKVKSCSFIFIHVSSAMYIGIYLFEYIIIILLCFCKIPPGACPFSKYPLLGEGRRRGGKIPFFSPSPCPALNIN